MKAKFFSFIGLIVASVGASLIFAAAPVHAQGEKYEWINANTIRASGGSYQHVTIANNGVLDFSRKGGSGGTVFEQFSAGSVCDITITITPSANNLNGTLRTQGCPDSAESFDTQFSIANPRKGPPPPGSNIDFANLNCGTDVTLQDRCFAVQACIETGKAKNDCLWGWEICMNDDNDTTACRQQVSSGNTTGEEVEDDRTTCAIDGLGWILCPALNLLAGLADGSYGIVSALLEVQPLLTTGTSEPTYQAWSVMRNFANVAFVIAFLIIIFSQITSIGVSNYGIKRMLPRLIIAAILVNISYWVCAIAVDISNILGSSIKDLFDNIGASIPIREFDAVQTGGGVWQQNVTAILTGIVGLGVVLYVGLSALVPMLISVVFAIVIVFLVLALRQALIILLVVISPLAFVAYLLPNTESWFSKWRSFFQTLLLMYPIIGLIFGASALASQVVTSSADGLDQPQLFVVQVMGAGIAVIPLIITPIVMKTAGSVLGRFGAMINNPNKGPFDRAKRAAEGYRANRQTLRQARGFQGKGLPLYGAGVRMKARREAVNASREAGLKSAKTRYVADEALKANEKLATKMAGGSGVVGAPDQAKTAVIASALSQEKKALQEDVSDMEALIKVRFDQPEKALEEALKSGDKVQAMAAQNILFKSGGSGVSKFRDTIQDAEKDPGTYKGLDKVANDMKSNVKDNHGQYTKQKGADIIKWASSSGADLTNSSAGQLSDNDLAGQHSGGIEKMVNQNNVSAAQAARMLKDPRVGANLDDSQKAQLQRAIDEKRDGSGPPKPPTTPSPVAPPPPAAAPPPVSPPPSSSPTPPPPAPSIPDTRTTPTPEQLDIAHEEGNVMNALHEMDRRDRSGPR